MQYAENEGFETDESDSMYYRKGCINREEHRGANFFVRLLNGIYSKENEDKDVIYHYAIAIDKGKAQEVREAWVNELNKM